MSGEVESMIPMAHPTVSLPVFEGPMDLLLFLIKRQEVDIYDIPIEQITKQYLEALYAFKELNLDLAGDFFVMAATLMYIKSRMLLPKDLTKEGDEEVEEEDDPRWELVQQLMAYKEIKDRTKALDAMIQSKQSFFDRFIGVEKQDDRPLKSFERLDVWQAFNNVLHRLAEKIYVGQIHDEQVSVSDQMAFILKIIEKKGAFFFSELIEEGSSLTRVVATFLGLLELVRLKKLTLEQDEHFADIYCKKLLDLEDEV